MLSQLALRRSLASGIITFYLGLCLLLFRSSSGQYLMSRSYLRAGAVRAGGTGLGGRRQTPRAEERVMVSRVAVGFHAPRTGLGFLFSLISQSPLKFHISCYEIWHTSGFFSPFLSSSRLSADSLREPAALPPSIPLSIVLERLVPTPSLPADGLLGAGCPFHPFCPFKTLLSLAAFPSS